MRLAWVRRCQRRRKPEHWSCGQVALFYTCRNLARCPDRSGQITSRAIHINRVPKTTTFNHQWIITTRFNKSGYSFSPCIQLRDILFDRLTLLRLPILVRYFDCIGEVAQNERKYNIVRVSISQISSIPLCPLLLPCKFFLLLLSAI